MKVKRRKTEPWAMGLIIFLTLLISIGQILWKTGSNASTGLLSMLLNPYIIGGFLIYGVAAGLMMLAFRYGELSVLYPLFATTYIWVSILSVAFFSEAMGLVKWSGIGFIILGVSFIGRGSQ
ncbi:MAG: EamA family transporter [DPANN group archaeon]|nr:EamA family transporter [DPANN group archaeon]